MARTAISQATDRDSELRRILLDLRQKTIDQRAGRWQEVSRESAIDERHAEPGTPLSRDDDLPLHLMATQTKTIKNIDDALERLKHGQYGRCDDCGDEIAPNRLRYIPFAVRCKDCEEKDELAKKEA